jgi:hypothetical protein
LELIIQQSRIKKKEEAVSKIAFAENHHFPAPEGCADFQRLPPFREGVRRR